MQRGARNAGCEIIEIEPRKVVHIEDAVALEFGLTTGDLTGQSKQMMVCRPRAYAMWLVRQETALTYPQIGALFGGRDHSTVVVACKRARLIMPSKVGLEARLLRLAKATKERQAA